MKFDLEYLDRLAGIVCRNNLSEITLEDEENLISLRRGTASAAVPITVNEIPAGITAPAAPAEKPAEKKQPAGHKGRAVVSPMTGTFYSAPSPDDAPFAAAGDIIAAGQTVCIIEAMKLMNEIETDVSGRITEICFKNGESVEAGQALMYVEQA